jgi:hypothetical protein
VGERHKRRPPRGMYINHDDIVALASSAQTQIVPPAIITPTATALNAKSNVAKSANDDLLASMEREVVSLLTQVRDAPDSWEMSWSCSIPPFKTKLISRERLLELLFFFAQNKSLILSSLFTLDPIQ